MEQKTDNYEVVVADDKGHICTAETFRERDTQIPRVGEQISSFEDEARSITNSKKIRYYRVMAIYYPITDERDFVPRVYVKKI